MFLFYAQRLIICSLFICIGLIAHTGEVAFEEKGAPAIGNDVLAITAENYQTEVLESKVPVVLDAYTDWCGYCKQVAPVFAELSKETAGAVKFVKLNIEAVPSVANQLKINALPTFLFYKNGKIVDRQAGALDKNGFKAKFAHLFNGK